MDARLALKAVKALGIYGLCYGDGCLCLSFSIHQIDVQIRCFKEDPAGTAYVWSDYMLYGPKRIELTPLADEIIRQLTEIDDRIWRVRFCHWEDDHPPRCTWCHKPRLTPDGYLCERHLSDAGALEEYEEPQ